MNIFEVLADLMARLASEFYSYPTGTECFAQPRHYGAILLWGLMWFMIGFTPTMIGLIKYQIYKNRRKKMRITFKEYLKICLEILIFSISIVLVVIIITSLHHWFQKFVVFIIYLLLVGGYIVMNLNKQSKGVKDNGNRRL